MWSAESEMKAETSRTGWCFNSASQPRTHKRMPYILILLAGSIGLVLQYVLVTDASWWSKWLVAGLLGLCLSGNFRFLPLGLTGLLLQAGLSIYIAIHLMYAEARRARSCVGALAVETRAQSGSTGHCGRVYAVNTGQR
jgi:hypothetical protein